MTATNPWASTRARPSKDTFASVDQEAMKRLFFSTTAASSWQGSQVPEEGRGENYMDIHALGQRKSKYMELQLNTAPLLDRTCCNHTKAFQPLPLGDNAVNRALATNFKQGGASGMGGGINVSFSNTTAQEESHPMLTREQTMGARAQHMNPGMKVTRTIVPEGPLMVRRSTYVRTHTQMKGDLAKAERVDKPMDAFYLGGASKYDAGNTETKREYIRRGRNLRGSSSMPTL